jgi:hypothetical protein
MDSGVAILISAAFATAGWIYSGRIQRHTSRRQHTYGIITRQLDDDKFEKALNSIRKAVNERFVPQLDKLNPTEQMLDIDYLLNHYEFLSAAILCGDIDEKLLRSCEFSRMTKLYAYMRDYIEQNRTEFDQPTMFQNLEDIVLRWNRTYQPISERFLEVIAFRPLRRSPRWIGPSIALEHALRTSSPVYYGQIRRYVTVNGREYIVKYSFYIGEMASGLGQKLKRRK